MNKDLLPAEGECRCGKIAMRIDAPPILTMACHCSGCQKMSASAYSLTAAIPRDAFSVTRGEPVIGGLHGEDARHFFCPYCMTWLFTRLNDSLPFVNVRPTLFTKLAWSTPFIETWTREKLPWAKTPAVHSFPEFPPPTSFKGLLQAYAQHVQAQA